MHFGQANRGGAATSTGDTSGQERGWWELEREKGVVAAVLGELGGDTVVSGAGSERGSERNDTFAIGGGGVMPVVS